MADVRVPVVRPAAVDGALTPLVVRRMPLPRTMTLRCCYLAVVPPLDGELVSLQTFYGGVELSRKSPLLLNYLTRLVLRTAPL